MPRRFEKRYTPAEAAAAVGVPEQTLLRDLHAGRVQVSGLVDSTDLPTLCQYARGLAKEGRFTLKVARIRESNAWSDLGDLKRELLDLWMDERNILAKRVITDIEVQRRKATP
jgi:hypothetical protein